jgi:hypothetical protein
MSRFLVKLCRVIVSLGLGSVAISSLVAILIGPEHWAIFLGAAVVLGAGAYLAWPRSTWRDEAPSQRQLSYASDLGVRVPRGATKGQVSDLISRVTGR